MGHFHDWSVQGEGKIPADNVSRNVNVKGILFKMYVYFQRSMSHVLLIYIHLTPTVVKKVFIHHVLLLIPFYYIEKIRISDALIKHLLLKSKYNVKNIITQHVI